MLPSLSPSNLGTLQQMELAAINDTASNTSSIAQPRPLRSSSILADLIPAFVLIIYGLGIICWFRSSIYSCCRRSVGQRWRFRKGDARTQRYTEVAENDETDEDEENEQHSSASPHVGSLHDEESVIESLSVHTALSSDTRKKRRPTKLDLQGYTRLSSSQEDALSENESARKPQIRCIIPQQFNKSLNRTEWTNQFRKPLTLSKYFDDDTGSLRKEILLEPKTLLDEEHVENNNESYDGGLGNNIIGRWFDRLVHWVVKGSQSWLEPEQSTRISGKGPLADE